MKRIFIQMLPVMAAVLLATSCSKDDGGNSEFDSPIDNQQQTEAVSDAYKTITINGKLSQSSLSKVGVDGRTLKFEGGDEFSVGTEGDDVIITISITKDDGSYTAELQFKNETTLTNETGFTATHGTDPSAISEGYADLPTAVKNAYYTIDFIVVKDGEKYSLKDKKEQTSDIKANVKSAFVNAQSTGSITVSGNHRFIRKDNVYVLSSTATMGSSVKDITAGTIYAVKNAIVAPNNCLPGAFTVDASNTQVYFSKGNLQYNVTKNEWSFADPQHGYVGSANANFAGPLIDLFGWGTWLEGRTPTATNNCTWSDGAESAIGPDWFTLTQSQWTHLLVSRTTTSGVRYARACVEGVNGLIIVPDDWSKSSYELQLTNMKKSAYTSNTIDATTWKNTFESAGAVFLPAAGRRDNSTISNGGLVGIYWSSSVYNAENAHDVFFDETTFGLAYYGNNDLGYSVRLVRSF